MRPEAGIMAQGDDRSGFVGPLLRRIGAVSVVLGALTAALAALLGGAPAAYSVVAGVAVAFGNVWALAQVVSRLLAPTEDRDRRGDLGRTLAGVLLVTKMGVLGAVVWALVRYTPLAGEWFLAGVTAVVVGTLVGGAANMSGGGDA
jgi:hypothetical protein